MGKVMRLCSDF